MRISDWSSDVCSSDLIVCRSVCMTMRPTDAITDFGQFQGMRAGARNGDEATIRKAAQQFEALLTPQLFKNMRAGSLGDDVMGGGQTGFYQAQIGRATCWEEVCQYG